MVQKMKNHNSLVLQGNDLNIIDLYDSQFSIKALKSRIASTEDKASEIMESLKGALNNANDNEDDGDPKLFLVLDDDIKEALRKGDLKFEKDANGDLVAQLRRADGKYAKRLKIEEELSEAGVSIEDVEVALQIEAIKDLLNTILDNLETIEEKLSAVEQGQRNDRLGLFYSGCSLFIESSTVKDTYLQRQLVAQALKAVSDANSQVIQDMRTSLEYLINEKYKHSKKMTEKIEEHLNVIRQCCDLVFKATALKAMIYQSCGEIQSMVTAIDEYGRFIENLVTPYKGKLSELDKTSGFIESGPWGKIAKTREGCNEIRNQLSDSQPILLMRGA